MPPLENSRCSRDLKLVALKILDFHQLVVRGDYFSC
jgi:hypothetical protein